MKTLEEIKDEYVRDKFLTSYELDTWVGFQNYFASRHPEWFEHHWEEIAKRYATEVAHIIVNDALIKHGIGSNTSAEFVNKWIENNLPKHR